MRRGQQASIFYKYRQDEVVHQHYLDEPTWDVQKLMFLPILINNIDDSLVRRWTSSNGYIVRYKYYQ